MLFVGAAASEIHARATRAVFGSPRRHGAWRIGPRSQHGVDPRGPPVRSVATVAEREAGRLPITGTRPLWRSLVMAPHRPTCSPDSADWPIIRRWHIVDIDRRRLRRRPDERAGRQELWPHRAVVIEEFHTHSAIPRGVQSAVGTVASVGTTDPDPRARAATSRRKPVAQAEICLAHAPKRHAHVNRVVVVQRVPQPRRGDPHDDPPPQPQEQER